MRRASPLLRMMVPFEASHRRAALSAMASKTGWSCASLLLLRLRLALQRFPQADPRGFVPQRLPGDRSPGSNLSLCGLCSPTHRPLLASRWRYDRTEIDDRLGEGALVGKSGGRVLDAACERARFSTIGQNAD